MKRGSLPPETELRQPVLAVRTTWYICTSHADEAIRKILDEIKTSPSITDKEENNTTTKTNQ